jgi:hypothetical protein
MLPVFPQFHYPSREEVQYCGPEKGIVFLIIPFPSCEDEQYLDSGNGLFWPTVPIRSDLASPAYVAPNNCLPRHSTVNLADSSPHTHKS